MTDTSNQSDSVRMSPADAFRELELPSSAAADEVKAAYRRLAFEYHPDRNANRAASFDRFKRITRAYRTLVVKFHVDAEARSAGACVRCGRYADLRPGMDRQGYCPRCLLAAQVPLRLPGPGIVVVSCGFAIVSLAAATVLFIWFASNRRIEVGIGCLAACFAALGSLAWSAVTVGQVIHGRRTRRRTRSSRRRGQRPRQSV